MTQYKTGRNAPGLQRGPILTHAAGNIGRERNLSEEKKKYGEKGGSHMAPGERVKAARDKSGAGKRGPLRKKEKNTLPRGVGGVAGDLIMHGGKKCGTSRGKEKKKKGSKLKIW